MKAKPDWTLKAKKAAPAVCGLLIFCLAAMAVYLFSPHTKVQALSCHGNYYYTPQQVYSLAGVSVHSRTFSNSVIDIEEKLKEDPLIENAAVTKDGQNLKITIDEKTVIGYCEENGTISLVTSQKERIPVENEAEVRSLFRFPMLVDLSPDTINSIADQAAAHPEQLTKQIFEKIAEIRPWSESYDKNMLMLVLQDGNTVFTSIPSLFMMSTYQQILADLQGQNVCLMLDGDNGVINKKSCEYMFLSPEERAGAREIPKSVLGDLYTYSPASSEDNKNADSESSQSADSNQQTDPTAPDHSPASPEPPAEQQPAAPDPGTVTDWEAAAVPEMLYSPSANVFKSVYDGSLYTYDQASDTFVPFQ